MTCAPPPNDLDVMARRFIDLWQEQLTHMSQQPDMAKFMSQYAEMMGPFAQYQSQFQQFFSPEAAHGFTQSFSQPAAPSSAQSTAQSTATAGAAAAAAAFEPVARQLAQLSARVDALADQLTALAAERKPAPARAVRPRKTTGPAKPKRAGASAGKSRRR